MPGGPFLWGTTGSLLSPLPTAPGTCPVCAPARSLTPPPPASPCLLSPAHTPMLISTPLAPPSAPLPAPPPVPPTSLCPVRPPRPCLCPYQLPCFPSHTPAHPPCICSPSCSLPAHSPGSPHRPAPALCPLSPTPPCSFSPTPPTLSTPSVAWLLPQKAAMLTALRGHGQSREGLQQVRLVHVMSASVPCAHQRQHLCMPRPERLRLSQSWASAVMGGGLQLQMPW